MQLKAKEKTINKFCLMSIFVILAMLFSFANVSPTSAGSVTVFIADQQRHVI
jgi:CHASE3 domain sensor protein